MVARSRLDNKLGSEDQQKITTEAGTSLTAIVRDLFDAIDPDKVEADAKAAGNPEPDDAAMNAARGERIKQAANVFTGPLINLMDTIRRDNEQTIDHDNLDTPCAPNGRATWPRTRYRSRRSSRRI
ncbi:MAG: hypothetical protein R3D29_02590 [Nitratireductor sp.]